MNARAVSIDMAAVMQHNIMDSARTIVVGLLHCNVQFAMRISCNLLQFKMIHQCVELLGISKITNYFLFKSQSYSTINQTWVL